MILRIINNVDLIFITTLAKARACKGAGQERSSGIASHDPGSVRECKGMNPHTPKGAPTLGVGVPVDCQILKEQLQGSKPINLRRFLYH
jgi:hypothetical protein